VFYAVDGVYALEDILYWVDEGVFAGLKGEALVAHILERNNLGAYLFLRQFLAVDSFVLGVIGAIDTAVDAVVGEIERRKHYYAVAIETVFYLIGKGEYLLNEVGVVALEKQSCLAVCESLEAACFFEYLGHESVVAGVGAGIVHCGEYLAIVDELGCYG
jgi:hypothetical protein